jgi:hypothetical protein
LTDSVAYGRFFGMALFQVSLCLFSIISSNHLLVPSLFKTLAQRFSFVLTGICGLQVVGAIFVLTSPKDIDLTYMYLTFISNGAIILVNLVSIVLVLRRLYRKLKNPSGNEESLVKHVLLLNALSIVGFALGIMNVIAFFEQYQVMILMASRVVLTLTCGALVPFKIVYDKGLIRRVNGKKVYNRSYLIAGTEEFDGLTGSERPKTGNGTMA